MKRAISTVAAVIATLCVPLQANAQAPSDRWTFSLQPYLWLPSVEATATGRPRLAVRPRLSSSLRKTSLDSLNFALLLQGEARKGRWLIATDFIYLDMGSENSEVRSVDFVRVQVRHPSTLQRHG